MELPVKAMLKQDLAKALGYNDTSDLFEKVNNDADVLKQLEQTHYKKTSKRLSPKQVKIIYEFFG